MFQAEQTLSALLLARKLGNAMLIAVILLGASGCSVKFAYNNLDRLVRWGVSDYVDLNSAQKEVLQREIEQFQRWHRKAHLPLYAQYTRNLALQLSDGVTPAQIESMFTQFELWGGEVEANLSPLIIEIMTSLTDEQVAQLPANLARSNAEFAESEQGKELGEAQELWASEFADGLKNFSGRLTQSQRAYLQRRSLEYIPERVLWADYRARFQQELLDLLDQRSHGEAFGRAYRELIAKRESYYGDELTAVFANNQRLNQEAAAYVLSNLTEKQSERFVEALTELGEDFAELASES